MPVAKEDTCVRVSSTQESINSNGVGCSAFVSTKTFSTSFSGNIRTRTWLYLKTRSGYDHGNFFICLWS